MSFRALVLTTVAIIFAVDASLPHDKIVPLIQPKPITTSDKAALKYKPQLYVANGCSSFPAVNAAGKTNGGLKGTKGASKCGVSPTGSQVYGRSKWYKGDWAIMFSWYFPKGFHDRKASRRHDWASVVIWLDNPARKTQKILRVSLSISDTEYKKIVHIPPIFFAGNRGNMRYGNVGGRGSNSSVKVYHGTKTSCGSFLRLSQYEGEYQDLIMWNQLPNVSRAALEDPKNFGDARVPFTDANFDKSLGMAF
nr:Nep1-like protein [Hyaloperonospora arabidopsidis]